MLTILFILGIRRRVGKSEAKRSKSPEAAVETARAREAQESLSVLSRREPLMLSLNGP